MENTYLSFLIHTEQYALNVDKVLEVLDEEEEITFVPNAPDVIKGIINFRGEILPVFETRLKLNLKDREANQPYAIVILDLSTETETYRIGALVDKVKDVITISDAEIKPVPDMNQNFNSQFLTGVVRRENEFIMLIDAQKIFNSASKIEKAENIS